MGKTKLIKKKYLGVGYIHHFINIETGENLFVPCSEKEYNEMILPEIKGYKHFCSFGGQPKVDNENTMLNIGEYTITDDGIYIANLPNGETGVAFREIKEKDFNKKYENTI